MFHIMPGNIIHFVVFMNSYHSRQNHFIYSVLIISIIFESCTLKVVSAKLYKSIRFCNSSGLVSKFFETFLSILKLISKKQNDENR